ncbi:Molybdopterin synthase catalytic subunit 1 [Corynebacterium faecale]|uniref:molybdenum cofactor biosynthesis protein MoaE n=1 Tax=Corynebacterium faecale TaxID=1758466 RepID=UPI0025B58BDD|nr:molybdenum cofactor biosynthesis protein MoaE [Corynebacterium faecale]WJY91037.1 Molybdopterin synthase catalytic subunit 1 [Corynebacterium faecale]
MTTDPAYVGEQTGKLIDAFMTEKPLTGFLASAKAATCTDAMGALVVFEGVVRDHDGGSRVSSLTYTAHPTADAVIREVGNGVVAKHPRARLWTAHRTGALQIGDIAFLVVAAAAHRHDAFNACSELADAVKAQVPIWKEQELVGGDTEWVGL